jgi:hypothetical protein
MPDGFEDSRARPSSPRMGADGLQDAGDTAGVLRVEEGPDGRRAGGRSLRTDATRRVG